jgi:hypothetical protein
LNRSQRLGENAVVATAEITFDLDYPAETVFDYIADVRNELQWQRDLKRAEKVTGGPVGEGTIFDTDYRLFGPMRLELRDFRRPQHLAFAGVGPRMRMDFVMYVAQQDGGSRVSFQIEMRPQGLLRPLAPLLSAGLARELGKRPEQFRAALANAA